MLSRSNRRLIRADLMPKLLLVVSSAKHDDRRHTSQSCLSYLRECLCHFVMRRPYATPVAAREWKLKETDQVRLVSYFNFWYKQAHFTTYIIQWTIIVPAALLLLNCPNIKDRRIGIVSISLWKSVYYIFVYLFLLIKREIWSLLVIKNSRFI